MSETVIKFIILSEQKIISRILQFQVDSDTCWFRKVRLVKFNREPAAGQFGFKLDHVECILPFGEGASVRPLFLMNY